MPSQILICNSALVKVGADRISDITENKREAILLNAVWEQCRDNVLRSHKWNFATKRVSLTPTATTPDWGYDYEYDLPNGTLRIVDTDPDSIEYVIESDAAGNARVLRTDESSLDVLLLFQQSNMEAWDTCAAEALAWTLAESVAYALTQSLTLVDFCGKKAAAQTSLARSIDGTEGIVPVLEATDWTDARRS